MPPSSHPGDGPEFPDLGSPATREPRAPAQDTLAAWLTERCLSRREFLDYCRYLAGVLALPRFPFGDHMTATQAVAKALAKPRRLPLIWLNGQDCNGNIESFLRATDPTPSQLILDRLAVDYVELLMAPSGSAAEEARDRTIAAGGYVLVCEGSIPTGDGAAYACIGGRAYEDIVQEAAANAVATIAVGTCASSGGIPAAQGGVTGAVGVRSYLGPTATVIALPGCPMNVENLTATIVHYLTFGEWPATDQEDRPLFAYGAKIHETCWRRPHFDREEFVLAWGDEGHRNNWCLRYMGCQGPETLANCPKVLWNGQTSWPVHAGSVCLGCTMPGFWDVAGGFFAHRSDD